MKYFLLAASCCAFAGACARPADNGVDASLMREINGIKAIDNHAHPVRPTAAGEQPDREFDALPVDNLEAQSDPYRQRKTSPIVIDAGKQLYNNDRKSAMAAHKDDYATWVLDKIGVDIMLANRVAMGPGLPAARFLWVPFADALMYPLNNDRPGFTPDQKAFFTLEDKLLKRYYSESGVAAKPATLDEYLNKVVKATLERHKQGGALAEKFEMAYLRTLDIGNPSHADAEKAYAGAGDYKALQDYIFRFIASECGRLGMAIHIHAAHGGGGYFRTQWADPMLLEPLLDDQSLRKTNFVLIHGGWPYTREITPLLTKPNAYLDFSEQTAFNTPSDVAGVLRPWLAYNPEKVLFATDAYPEYDELGWEESGLIAANTGREALARALTAMMRDGEIDHARALELARMVLRDNARKLYKLK
ncbi:MAG TPA: amidohydrolase family protein [Gemmatimonadaceae bacterium]|nr:amidohydrolase family protein [Gemmatimonadaceae bacterium]